MISMTLIKVPQDPNPIPFHKEPVVMDGSVSTDGQQFSTWPRYKMIDDLEKDSFFHRAHFVVQILYFVALFSCPILSSHNGFVTKCLKAFTALTLQRAFYYRSKKIKKASPFDESLVPNGNLFFFSLLMLLLEQG